MAARFLSWTLQGEATWSAPNFVKIWNPLKRGPDPSDSDVSWRNMHSFLRGFSWWPRILPRSSKTRPKPPTRFFHKLIFWRTYCCHPFILAISVPNKIEGLWSLCRDPRTKNKLMLAFRFRGVLKNGLREAVFRVLGTVCCTFGTSDTRFGFLGSI